MTSLMIDLETLSTEMNAVVLSLGAQLFNNDGLIGDGFEVFFSVDEQIAMGRHVSSSTLAWWLTQEDLTRINMANNLCCTMPHNCYQALVDFITYTYRMPINYVWSNGANFDLPVLHLFRQDVIRGQDNLGIQNCTFPWNYYDERCYRTLIKIANVTKPYTTTHSALQDSKDQALLAIEAANKLGLTL